LNNKADMSENNLNIEKNCGQNFKNEQIPDIVNDSNFVFINDPSYETVVLYDVDGNIVNVNSWIECAHYVNGGWSTSFSNFDGNIFILVTTISLFGIYVLSKKLFNFKL
tara:strand:+ start:2809 stop:3135 length:327 start_codon:yes stop_codon:yes gene_type:complete